MKGSQFMQLRRHDSFGTGVPNALGVLFRREGTLVPLARKNCSMKLKGQSTAPISE
jgi:hypothetical protein